MRLLEARLLVLGVKGGDEFLWALLSHTEGQESKAGALCRHTTFQTLFQVLELRGL